MFTLLFDALREYLSLEMIRILTDLMADMNGMGLETLELPWVEAILRFFHQVGWALFLAGVSVAIFDCAIEAQSGKPAYRDMALNLIKGLLAVSLFTVVPVELFKFCISLQGQLGEAITRTFYMESFDGIGAIAQRIIIALDPTHTTSILVSLMMGYSIIKCFFANIKRGGIMVINIAVGAMYMLSVPRGFTDGFYGWCKQVAAICLTAVMQSTLLTAGLLTCLHHPLLGVGLMLSANEVPRIADRFGLDTSAKVNVMGSIHAANSMVAMVKGIARAAGH